MTLNGSLGVLHLSLLIYKVGRMIITQRCLWDFDALDTRDIKSLKTLKWYYLLDNIIFGNKISSSPRPLETRR